jgi:hypothetical protein
LSAIDVQKPRSAFKTEHPDSALRLELRAGEWMLWEGRVHRFEGLKGSRARILEFGMESVMAKVKPSF